MTAADEAPIRDDELTALFEPFAARRIALAVSGGVDSMVLLHLVTRWLGTPSGSVWLDRSAVPVHRDGPYDAPDPAITGPHDPTETRPIGLPSRTPSFAAEAAWLSPVSPLDHSNRRSSSHSATPPPVVILTVDHRLRADSRQDADLVAATARRLGLPHQTLVWADGAAVLDAGAHGLQRRAREARYGLIADVVESECWQRWLANPTTPADASQPDDTSGAPCPLHPGPHRRLVVTAHHRDDLIETFLMRLKRGSGLAGLSAIRTFETLRRPPVASRPYPARLDLCRPLLDVPKRRLLATARAAGLVWREDPSNTNPRFERVAQRQAMPALEQHGLTTPALHLTIRRLQRAHAAVERAACAVWLGEPGRPPAVDDHGGLFASYDANIIGTLEPEIHVRVLAAAIAAFGGGEEAPELTQLEALEDHLRSGWRHDGDGIRDDGPATARTLAGCRIDYDRRLAGARCPGSVRAKVRIWREAGRKGCPVLQLTPGDGAWWDHRFALSVSTAAPEPVTVRALGANGWAEIKRRHPVLAAWRGVPPGAAATLPAIWRETSLIALPGLDALVSHAKKLTKSTSRGGDPSGTPDLDPSAHLYNAIFSPAAGP